MSTKTQNILRNIKVITINSWKKFQELVADKHYQGWAFRGQENHKWHLLSTLSRYLSENDVNQQVWAHQEDRILRIFQRKAKQFTQHIPHRDEMFEWLALMQHHGAPTRLLDFTWSPFVAAFFALEKAKPLTDCAVWAVSYKKIREWNLKLFSNYRVKGKQLEIAPRNGEKFHEFYGNKFFSFVATGEPFNMSQRMIAQSGTFLIPNKLDQSVEEILKSCPDPENTIVKFILKTDKIREEAMRSLYLMNITNATLFPGLDGMARSLNYELEFHWGFNPKTAENFQEYLDFINQ